MNKILSTAGEVAQVVIIFSLWILGAAFLKLWAMCIMFSLICVTFGAWEGYCAWFSKEHKSVSQQFWKFSETNKIKAWVYIGMMMGGWILLMVHFAWKMLFGKKD